MIVFMPNPVSMTFFGGIMAINFFAYAVLISWQYSLVSNLSKLFPEGVTLNMTLFKICVIIPLIVILLAFYMMYDIVVATVLSSHEDISVIDFRWLGGIFFLSAVSMVAAIYVLFTMARALVTVEKQRKVEFGDFIIEFILFWFWIVGIWILQPRINAIFSDPSEIQRSAKLPPPIPG